MKICRIFGIDVRAHWSLLILGILCITIFNSVSSKIYPDFGIVYTSLTAIAFAISCVLSIFAHEMGHVFVGRKSGVPFSSITLFVFGGAARMDNMPKSPKAEAITSAAGPATSIIISVLLFAVWFSVCVIANIFGMVPSGPVAMLINMLIKVNLIVGIFNLLPACPLDGGRIFRAAIWKWKNNFLDATIIATRVSKGFMYCLMLVGILVAMYGNNVIGGIWIFIIGLMIGFMAKQELKMARYLVGLDRI